MIRYIRTIVSVIGTQSLLFISSLHPHSYRGHNTTSLLVYVLLFPFICAQATQITCDSTTPCSSSIITCDPYDHCTVSCDAYSSCGYKTINGPINKNLTVTCANSGSYACQYATINAQSSTHLTLICNSYSGCRETNIYGPTTGNLDVQCSNSYACRYANINAPNTGNLTVECGASTSTCYDVTIQCPIYGFCNVHNTLPSSYALSGTVIDAQDMMIGVLSVTGPRQATVYCPGNMGECHIYCDSDYACYSSTIYTQSDTDNLTITGAGYHSLSYANIHCPGSECNIYCDGNYACYYSSIYTQNDTHKLVITAVGIQSLGYTDIYCPEGNGTCSIHATGITTTSYNVFYNTDIYTQHLEALSLRCNNDTDNIDNCYSDAYPPRLFCQSDYDSLCPLSSELDCDGFNTTFICDESTAAGVYGRNLQCSSTECAGKDIYCANNQDCAITCSGYQSCQNTKINPPIDGNLTVECTGSAACSNMHVKCPTNGRCYVQSASGTSTGLVVYAAHMISGSLWIESARDANIKCPGNENECIIGCGDYGCYGSIITAASDTALLDITAHGTQALHSAHIYCPSAGGMCSIKAIAISSGLLSNTKIYSANGFNDMLLSCAHPRNTDNCYDTANPPRLFCQYGYGSVCNVRLQSGWDEFECHGVQSSVVCDNSTANGYYASSFVCNDAIENTECANMVCNENEDCDVSCTASLACQFARITGPSSGDLSVECHASYACSDAIIIGPTNGYLSVSCQQSGSCKDLSVYCPTKGSCAINAIASSSATDVISSMQIYALYGLQNVSLVCSYSGSATYCYNINASPELFCQMDFSASCFIILQSGSNEWECNDIHDASEMCFWSQEPTNKPTEGINTTVNHDDSAEIKDISTTYIDVEPSEHDDESGNAVHGYMSWLSTEIALGIIGVLVILLCIVICCSCRRHQALQSVIRMQSLNMVQKLALEDKQDKNDDLVEANVNAGKDVPSAKNVDVIHENEDCKMDASSLPMRYTPNMSDEEVVDFVVKSVQDAIIVSDDDDKTPDGDNDAKDDVVPGSYHLRRVKTNANCEGKFVTNNI